MMIEEYLAILNKGKSDVYHLPVFCMCIVLNISIMSLYLPQRIFVHSLNHWNLLPFKM